jgi:hypothetical protein
MKRSGGLRQIHWRIAGAIAIGSCAVLAYGGANWEVWKNSRAVFALYWGGFGLLMLLAMYCALLDIRYIRVQYRAREREVFNQTLGEVSFRKDLRDARTRAGNEPDPEDADT